MMQRQPFHIYLTSADSKEYYPGNTPSDFTVRFKNPIPLPGHWVCTLLDATTPKGWRKESLICANVCDVSFTPHGNLPILRRGFDRAILNLQYIPVVKQELTDLRIFLLSNSGVAFKQSPTDEWSCVLYFVPTPGP